MYYINYGHRNQVGTRHYFMSHSLYYVMIIHYVFAVLALVRGNN